MFRKEVFSTPRNDEALRSGSGLKRGLVFPLTCLVEVFQLVIDCATGTDYSFCTHVNYWTSSPVLPLWVRVA